MSLHPTNYALGTCLRYSMPYGIYQGGAALCSDGIVRKLKRIAMTADSFFSVPASVEVKCRTVAGYVSVETMTRISSTPTDGDPAVLRFHRVDYGKNAALLSPEPFVFTERDLLPCRVLAIDAWAEGGSWNWNNWWQQGTVPLYVCDMKPRQLLAYLRSEGHIGGGSGGDFAVEDDQHNIVIVKRRTRQPVLALEYGAASA